MLYYFCVYVKYACAMGCMWWRSGVFWALGMSSSQQACMARTLVLIHLAGSPSKGFCLWFVKLKNQLN